MTTKAPSRFWIIRHQDQGKPQVIGKFDTAGGTIIPDKVANYDTFQVLEVSEKSGLEDQTVDHSGLTDAEKDVLRQVYPVQS